jgi:hypothetical protein
MASWLSNMAAHTADAIRHFPGHFKDRSLEYASAEGIVGTLPRHANVNDTALNFFARAILEHNYDFVIEIGAYSLDRTKKLASLFPNKKFFALDIGPDYITKQVIGNVTLLPNDLATISSLAKKYDGRGLICSHGTLSYYCPALAEDLISVGAQSGLDIALVEPNAIGENSRACSMQRSRKSWYHPYLLLLRSNGYVMPDANGHQIGTSFSAFGEWYTYILAMRPTT